MSVCTPLQAFGYCKEDEELILKPMMESAHEPIGSMGDDTPIAAFSTKPQLVYRYFKQRFAEVTNPPIDPLLERRVAIECMSPVAGIAQPTVRWSHSCMCSTHCMRCHCTASSIAGALCP